MNTFSDVLSVVVVVGAIYYGVPVLVGIVKELNDWLWRYPYIPVLAPVVVGMIILVGGIMQKKRTEIPLRSVVKMTDQQYIVTGMRFSDPSGQDSRKQYQLKRTVADAEGAWVEADQLQIVSRGN